jgi:hypothetical protein
MICIDANLPTLEKCQYNCDSNSSILCIHRFKTKVFVEHFNTKRFSGWSDLRVFTYFLGQIITNIAEGRIRLTPDCLFIILTKDRNFLEDIKREWESQFTNGRLKLMFKKDTIVCGGLKIIVRQINCPNYGSKKSDDLRCCFLKVNKLLDSLDQRH